MATPSKLSFVALFDGELPKLPTTLGWELEYANRGDHTYEQLQSTAFLDKCGFPPSLRPTWHGEHCGIESNSPVFSKLDTIDPYLDAFFKLLKDSRMSTSNSCGGHLHIGLDAFRSPRDLARFLIAVNLCQPFFFSGVPAYRKHNTYCQAVEKQRLKGYVAAVRKALPLIMGDSRLFNKVRATFPENLRPTSAHALQFPSPFYAASRFDQGITSERRMLAALRPNVALGLPVMSLSDDAPQYLADYGGFGWVRHNSMFETLEFRLFPTTLKQQEWAGYVALVTWFVHKFKVDNKDTFSEILSHSDEELLGGVLPFNDWPSPLLDWLLTHKYVSKKHHAHPVNSAPSIAPARAVA